tara:strand:+ start:312 stop:743 length:432 start_codon:yes stop_codon:yes gene_type:complete
MKVYLSTRPQPAEMIKSYTWISSLDALEKRVANSEASAILCDNFLSTVPFDAIGNAMRTIISKMRINCEITILNTDIAILCEKFTREEINIDTMNVLQYGRGAVKSAIPSSIIEDLLPENVKVTEKHFDLESCQICIKARRLS